MKIKTNVKSDNTVRQSRVRLLLCLPLFGLLGSLTARANMVHGHPNRGTTNVTGLFCRFSNSPSVGSPYDQLSYYQNMFFADNPFRSPGTGSLKNYFGDISQGALNLTGSVHGWYTEPRTWEVGTKRGNYVNQDCIDAAKAAGYTPPAGSIVVVVTTPGSGSVGGRCETTDLTGCKGWALVPADVSFATMAHELGHSLDLTHSYSREPSLGDVEYGDDRDLMSNPQGSSWPAGLNGTNLDRMGWLRQGQILTVGADGGAGSVFRLKPLYSSSTGYKVLRIPAEAGNPQHFYTVEFRTKTGWDSGISIDSSTGGIVLIHETYSGGPNYLLLSAAVSKQTCSYTCNPRWSPPCQNKCTTTTTIVPPGVPVQNVRFNGGWLFGVTGIENGEAVISVSLPSTLITTAKSLSGQNTCMTGYVWRSADSMDYVCVAPWVFVNTISENAFAPFNRSPLGGGTCLSGYVWREAYPGDHVCVVPWSRSQAADDNQHAAERVTNP